MRRLIFWLMMLLILAAGFSQPVEAGLESTATDIFLPIVPSDFVLGKGQIVGKITDAQTGNPIGGVSTCLAGTSNCMITDSDGVYTIDGAPAGINYVQATPTGTNHSPLTLSVSVVASKSVVLNFSLSPALKLGEYRIVLTWSPNPSYYALDGTAIDNDLDAYLWVPDDPDPYLVYWNDTGNCDAFPNACLEHDVQQGNGPETDLILPLTSLGDYHYAVYDYAYASTLSTYPGAVPPITNSAARVQIYNFSGLLYDFLVPPQGDGAFWHVFDIDGATAEIVPVNVITWTPPGPLSLLMKQQK
jgi:hypothetical protein